MRRRPGIVLGVVIAASLLSGCTVIARSEDAKRNEGKGMEVNPYRDPVHSVH
jgi:hypothetical protein